MKILFDFSPIKTGGGAQLALNFIDYLKKNNTIFDYDILISDKFPFFDRLPKKEIIISPSNYFKRMLFENTFLKKKIQKNRYTHIYTFFGPGLPCIKNVRQVVSVAYPIICYDDSIYWKKLSKKNYLRKKTINFFRKMRLKSADHLIFETEVMQKRCIIALGLREGATTVIPPSPTLFLSDKRSPDKVSKICKFLILSGLDQHKNISRLIEVVKRAHADKILFKLVISCHKDSLFSEKIKNKHEISDFIINNYFIFKGAIPPDSIQDIYDEVDVVMNISDLESFSNNYMEAWRTGKPILASDRDFSRHICGSSAIYCEPHDIDSLYGGIKKFIDKSVDIQYMIQCGKRYLADLPDLDNRIQKIKAVLFQ